MRPPLPSPWRSATFVLLCASLAIACPADGPGPSPEPDIGPSPPSGLLVDPLSIPEEPTLDPTSFTSAEVCAGCHQEHYAQWRTSMHAYSMVDPVFRKLVEIRQAEYGGLQDGFCTQCHSAIGTRGGECQDGFDFESLSPIVLEGITCESCHKVSSIERTWNSGHVLDAEGPIRGTLADPVDSAFHQSEESSEMSSSAFCGACHDVVEVSGLNLERPYQEWLESPAAEEGRSCQSCHMPAFDGIAGVGGPERTGLHDHRFVGVDVPLLEGWLSVDEEAGARERIEALLATAASLELNAAPAVLPGEQLDLYVSVTNEIDAHALPTGSTFIRQVWLHVIARDAEGRVLYETGQLDDNGDLMDFFSELAPFEDDDLIKLGSSLIDERGEPTVFPWKAAEHFTTALPPKYSRTWTLFVPVPDDAVGPVTIEARLRLRNFPPFLLRLLGFEALVERISTWELADDGLEVDLL